MTMKTLFASMCSALVLSAVLASTPSLAMSRSLDPDKDGTMDMPEAMAAGRKVFARLDPDRDGTLDAAELSGRVNAAGLKAADPDADSTLDVNEYMALIKERFMMANPDDDQTLDDKELRTAHGRALLGLIQ